MARKMLAAAAVAQLQSYCRDCQQICSALARNLGNDSMVTGYHGVPSVLCCCVADKNMRCIEEQHNGASWRGHSRQCVNR
jgi:hypothetical protein